MQHKICGARNYLAAVTISSKYIRAWLMINPPWITGTPDANCESTETAQVVLNIFLIRKAYTV